MAMPKLPPRLHTPKNINLPAEDSNLMQEIDDTLRAEKMAQIWRDFGGVIVAASIAVLLATVGWVIWKNHVESENLDSTSHLIQAQATENQGKFSEAAEQYARIGLENKEKRVLAALYEADALMRAGQNDKAITTLKNAVGTDTNNSDGFKELARLKLGAIQAQMNDPKMLEDAASLDKPFNFTAREIKAMKMLEAGKHKEAQELLKSLSLDPVAPFTLKQRAEKMLATQADVAPGTTSAAP